MAFGLPVSLTLDDLMAGRTQPMGAGERTKAAGPVGALPAGLRAAVAVSDKASGPRHAGLGHSGSAALGVATLDAGVRRTSDLGLIGASLVRPAAAKPALAASRAMPKAVTKSQSAAAAIPVREAPAKFRELGCFGAASSPVRSTAFSGRFAGFSAPLPRPTGAAAGPRCAGSARAAQQQLSRWMVRRQRAWAGARGQDQAVFDSHSRVSSPPRSPLARSPQPSRS